MWTRSELEQIRELFTGILDDADAEIIHAIRVNAGAGPYQNVAGRPHMRSRENLLSELDALERVRERLNVRFDEFDQPS